MKTIYVIEGQTGEYDDFQSWLVAAHTTLEAAEKHRTKCHEFVEKEINPMAADNWRVLKDVKNPYDSAMHVDYTGVTYTIDTLKLYEGDYE